MNKSRKIYVLCFLCIFCFHDLFAPNNVYAETSGSESSEITIMDYMYAGDGQTPPDVRNVGTSIL